MSKNIEIYNEEEIKSLSFLLRWNIIKTDFIENPYICASYVIPMRVY